MAKKKATKSPDWKIISEAYWAAGPLLLLMVSVFSFPPLSGTLSTSTTLLLGQRQMEIILVLHAVALAI